MIKVTDFGTYGDGSPVKSITIESGLFSVELLTLGATIRRLMVPDRNGNVADVVLGHDSVKEYMQGTTYFGMTIGPFANRIGKARFFIDGKEYHLEANINDGTDSLHSGSSSLCWKNWAYAISEIDGTPTVVFTSGLQDGEGNWPGPINASVFFSLSSEGKLRIRYQVISKKKTYLNFTNHSYFNLTGDVRQGILGHEVLLPSKGYVEVDGKLIPTGRILPCQHTPFDFSFFHEIGERIALAGGYDHCFAFADVDGKLQHRVTVREKNSGRQLDISTTMPAIQMYTSNTLSSETLTKEGIPCCQYGGLALETEFYPDSPNQPTFPSCLYGAGKVYEEVTEYTFSVC
ncbi:MAG: galactose mutarotase [Spirochaetia bacterium]|nr:galactose mutarotase [Spirochaetia bacterium]